MRAVLRLVALGFFAAAISVLSVHQGTLFALAHAGLTDHVAWGLQPVPPWGVPRLVSSMFWGGLWGALFALLHERLPGRESWLKGLVYGLFVAVVGSWTLVPLIKGHVFGQADQALFGGLDPKRMLVTLVAVGAFGLALGVIYDLVKSK